MSDRREDSSHWTLPSPVREGLTEILRNEGFGEGKIGRFLDHAEYEIRLYRRSEAFADEVHRPDAKVREDFRAIAEAAAGLYEGLTMLTRLDLLMLRLSLKQRECLSRWDRLMTPTERVRRFLELMHEELPKLEAASRDVVAGIGRPKRASRYRVRTARALYKCVGHIHRDYATILGGHPTQSPRGPFCRVLQGMLSAAGAGRSDISALLRTALKHVEGDPPRS